MEPTNTIVAMILNVFSNVSDWIIGTFPEVMEIFYANGNLTILGVLAVCGLAFSVIFLIMGIIQRFLHFRG